ncbi:MULTISPECIES: SDR family NAD(P)-dependent oxidoreductase [unclassified Actinomyces]|uniref:SDR family NAD(P)-dependent oxidoreductase n=1 Tax=unclassified Actinomyces TaxID=2609248 RepID=UPI000D599D21|nr:MULTISPECIES: SDR family oxidoreductase [unclassified Actinomyces]RAX21322.1 SDR family NAD(P)-dependent oxidoreductase [Actinomyces sp. Z5]RAX22650.1 SDR family NAD(P)-dependent oxidoreductase [Actinomyces sp. Z3]
MRALVTGGSSGIGAAACLRIAEAALARGEQACVAVCGRERNDTQDQIAQKITEMGGEALILVGDLRDPDTAQKLVDETVKAFGGIDALVANAGIACPGQICDLSLEDWDEMLETNLRGAWLLAKAAYPHLKTSRGAACFTSSMSAQQPHAGSGAYSPAKAGLTMMAQTLALEWAPDGIRSNVVSPGMTRTGMTEAMYTDPEIKRKREQIIPLGRIGTPMDVANVIEFLISPLAGYVTGQDVCVDGGFSKSILSTIPGRPSSR